MAIIIIIMRVKLERRQNSRPIRSGALVFVCAMENPCTFGCVKGAEWSESTIGTAIAN